MKIKVQGNFMDREEFKSKDGSKKFHNCKILVDDTMFYFKFIRESDYNLLSGYKRLDPVPLVIDVILAETDNNNNNIYKVSLVSIEKKGD